MSLKGLRTVVYKVPNLEEAKQWYKGVLGFDPYFDEPYYVGFNVGGYELGLLPIEENHVPGNNSAAYWGVDNVDEMYNKMIDAGATSFEKPQNVGGELVVAAVKDPWENVVGIIYNPDFKVE